MKRDLIQDNDRQWQEMNKWHRKLEKDAESERVRKQNSQSKKAKNTKK